MRKPSVEPSPYLIGYARVSTEDQTLNLQLDALERAGVDRDNVYVEKVSTRKAKRRMLEIALRELRPGDTFVVWRLDRIARNVREIYEVLDQINDAGAAFRSLTENFDFSTSTGKLMLTIMAAMAEFERNLISDRTAAGMKAARERGVVPGRKQKFTPDLQRKAEKMLLKGFSRAEVARQCGIAVNTLGQYFKSKRLKNGKVRVTRIAE